MGNSPPGWAGAEPFDRLRAHGNHMVAEPVEVSTTADQCQPISHISHINHQKT